METERSCVETGGHVETQRKPWRQRRRNRVETGEGGYMATEEEVAAQRKTDRQTDKEEEEAMWRPLTDRKNYMEMEAEQSGSSPSRRL